MKKKLKYEDYIERSILLNNEYDITEVHDLVDLKEIGLIRDDYPKLSDAIRKGNLPEIQNWPGNLEGSDEFVVIMTFTDQQSRKYVVTTYDADIITHDPQVIDIFPWSGD